MPPSKLWFLATASFLAGVGLLALPVFAVGFFRSAPAPATIGDAPADLHAETVAIASASRATLSGWFIKGQPGRGAVVLLHGVKSNRLSC